ncbi:MAG TPA: hypothetical protein VK249_22765 [Anaerolineales bacterium]|nr:hypothetical protein [Anaerolineales bacterium]
MAEEARLVYKQSPSWQNALYLLDAYQRRYAAYLSAIVFSALIGAWLLKLKVLLAIPAFMVIYGLFWDLKFIIDGSWKQKRQIRVLISSLFRDGLLGILTYVVYAILGAK